MEELGISAEEWEQTPSGVRTALRSLQHQVRLLEIRCAGYERQIAARRQQVEELDELKAELTELRERLGMNSQNSSKPPSSDPVHQRTRKKREPTGRRRGGQPDHPGRGRKLKPASEVDHIVELRPVSCRQCGHLLLGDDPEPARHQVSEVPPAKAEITEYRRHRLTCVVCGTMNQAGWPAQMPRGCFGPRAQGLIGYLTGRLGVSHRDVIEVMEVLHGLDVSLGSVPAIQRRVSQALADPVQRARQFVQQQRAQYVDETGWRESQQRKWLWVNVAREVTVFQVLGGRRGQDAKQVINEAANGIVTTDRYGAYNWLASRRRQICWAHLKRDFQALVDRGGESAQIGRALLQQEHEMFQLWYQVCDGTLSRQDFRQQMKPIQQRVKELLQAGTRGLHKKTRRTCINILNVEKSLWTFVRVDGLEPTNNQAERALRRAVLWRRKSFGTHSKLGSRFVEQILTAVTTLRQQGRDVLEYLTATCASAGRTGSELLPQPP